MTTRSIQYSIDNGATFVQFTALSTDDLTVAGILMSVFNCVKDSNDNLYIFMGDNFTGNGRKGRVMQVDKNGNKKWVNLYTAGTAGTGTSQQNSRGRTLVINRAEDVITYTGIRPQDIPVSLFSATGYDMLSTATSYLANNHWNFYYKDLYLWYVATTTVTIREAPFSVNKDTETCTQPLCCCLSITNVLYALTADKIQTFEFNSTVIVKKADITTTGAFTNAKECVMDKDGNILVLINTGTESSIKKYTTAGTQVGSTLDLGGIYYNLNTDYLGNIFYSNATSTYKSPYSSTSISVGSQIRGSGMSTYNNNITSFDPATNAP